MSTLSEALITKMTENQLSQAQLASILGISPSLLSLLLSGRRTPSLNVTKSIYHLYPDLVDILLK